MRILITGGAGFIGSHLADALLDVGHEVSIIDDLSGGRRENIPEAAVFFEVDIRDRAAVSDAFAACRPEVVSHQAAQVSVAVSTREPARDARINIEGSLNLLEAAVEQGAQRFVFASTGGAIYGEVPEGERAREDWNPLPLSPYACAKLAVESYLRFYANDRGLAPTVLRYANVYGPRQDSEGEAGVVAIFARRLLAGDPIQINGRKRPGDDGCQRDYVYVRDVVRANLEAIEGRIPEHVLSVCTGASTSTRALATKIQTQLDSIGAKAASEVGVGDRRAGDLERSVLDPARFLERVGEPVPLSEGLEETLRWFARSTP